MLVASQNFKAGILIASGAFLFMAAIGINTLYSMQTVCLDVLPQQCYSGYDNLPEAHRLMLTPGLYLMSAAVAAAGVILWFGQGYQLRKSA
ncbi:MAG TPA: hypothetical protein VJL54_04860 [Nitrososphaera sp.]|nr:hypothetical protein [Nitrososphaera sp.]